MDLEAGRSDQERAMEIMMDSCAARSVMAYVGGYVMGAGFSVFGMMLGGSQQDNVGVKEFWRRAGRNSLKMGRGFAVFGFFFSGFEAVLEKRRGKHDWKNAGIAGGTIGGVQGYRFGGPAAAVAGAGAGAGFCALIDWFMDM
eukprot:TRINITY_DN21354_c0_g1_i1.p2 TRINITY_DN21354_c0_g1~~TRINITY_DN21354_c0_g1_i1.p2  ORF type:complete len:156 (+),score=36.10 TRINITY_DN21354_c0_g1_i1:45-470(+)